MPILARISKLGLIIAEISVMKGRTGMFARANADVLVRDAPAAHWHPRAGVDK